MDGGSCDKTQEIAKSFGVKWAVKSDWEGFGIQRQRSLELASGDWVLWVDADERVSPELATAIVKVVQQHENSAFKVKRRSVFLGKQLHDYSYKLRLARREQVYFEPRPVHEKMSLRTKNGGRPQKLQGELIHLSYESVDRAIHTTLRYSRLGAELALKRVNHPTVLTAVIHGLSAFLKSYFLKGCFLDGGEGFIFARLKGFESYMRYIYARELLRKEKERPD